MGAWKMRSVESAEVESAECRKCVENFNFPFQFPIPMRKNSVFTIKKENK